MTNTLIAITASATPARGYSYSDAETVLSLFGDVLHGRATPETLDRMVGIVGNAQPITASARRSMQAVRLPGDKARKGLAGVSDSYWKRYRAEHPKPAAPNRQPRISTMRRQNRRAK